MSVEKGTYIEATDIEMMKRVTSSLRDRLLVRLLFHLSCRVSEALAIKSSDVDFVQGNGEGWRRTRGEYLPLSDLRPGLRVGDPPRQVSGAALTRWDCSGSERPALEELMVGWFDKCCTMGVWFT